MRLPALRMFCVMLGVFAGCSDSVNFPQDASDVSRVDGTDTAVGDTAADTPADVAPACPTGQTRCGATCVSLATDTMNCGACGTACSAGANGMAACVGGTCTLACAAGFGDCDAMAANGCETRVSDDVRNCGRCRNSCSPQPNASPSCAMGTCGLVCTEGLGNCDGMVANGCETPVLSNAMHCGRCGNACPTGSICSNGTCAMVSTSCRALHMAAPMLPSGTYMMDPDAAGPLTTFAVYCDMTTDGGGWTLVAAAAGANNMPRFTTPDAAPCASATPTAPCFLGAANLAALAFTDFAWSTDATATNTRGPIDRMTTGAPSVNAICINANEYYRFNQDDGAQGMGWTGCMPTEYYMSRSFCESSLRNVWNLLTCDGLAVAPGTRSSPDYSCSPFGRTNPFGPADLCTEFMNVRHWRR